MAPLSLSTPPVRDPKNLRERVDAKLGQGTGMSMTEARDLLSPAERMEWALAECLFSMMDRRFHIWVQGWCLDRGVDGPAVVAAIAEMARPLDGVVADLLRWTSLRGVWARTGERKEALFNVVPEVWAGAWDRVAPFAQALSSRWPEDVDPFALPAPPPWARPASFTKPRLAFTEAGSVMEATAYALWANGLSEDDLDAFFWEGGENLHAAVTKRVDCDAEALRALLHPPDPLAIALGVEKMKFPSLHVAAPEREAEILKAAEVYNTRVLRPPVVQAAKIALRSDPDLLVAWTRDLDPAALEILKTCLETGHAVLLFGAKGDIPADYFSTS